MQDDMEDELLFAQRLRMAGIVLSGVGAAIYIIALFLLLRKLPPTPPPSPSINVENPSSNPVYPWDERMPNGRVAVTQEVLQDGRRV